MCNKTTKAFYVHKRIDRLLIVFTVYLRDRQVLDKKMPLLGKKPSELFNQHTIVLSTFLHSVVTTSIVL